MSLVVVLHHYYITQLPDGNITNNKDVIYNVINSARYSYYEGNKKKQLVIPTCALNKSAYGVKTNSLNDSI